MGNNDSFGYWDDGAPSRISRRWLGFLGVAISSSCLTCALLFALLHLPFTARVLRPIFGLDPKVTPDVVQVKPTSTRTPTPNITPTASALQATSTPTLNTAEAQIVYHISQTTERTFDAQTSEADAAALLTSFGLPLTEQSVPVGVNSPQASWQVAGIVNDIQGAVYDDATGQLFLIGVMNPDLPPLDPTDLLVALRAVYTSGESVGVSIDPINPNELGGPMQVNYYGNTAKTHFGLVMFEADRHLKTLSSGEDNITGQPATSAVPGYKSELAWMLDLGSGDANPSWHRMWYVVPNGELAIKVSADGRAVIFDEVPIVVQARFVQFDASGAKHDVSGNDPAIDAFVGHLNQHFDAYAAEKPEVGQLKSLAKLLSIARWLYDQGAALDLDWLSGFPVDTVQTPDTTPGTITSLSRSDAHTVYTVQLFGGVDFQFENRVVVPPAGDPVHFLGERVRAAVTQSESNVAVLAANGAEIVQICFCKMPGGCLLASW